MLNTDTLEGGQGKLPVIAPRGEKRKLILEDSQGIDLSQRISKKKKKKKQVERSGDRRRRGRKSQREERGLYL